MIKILLNLPYTILGLVLAALSLPKKIKINRNPFVVIFTVRAFWWEFGYMKNMRAFVLGSIVALGQNQKPGDLEHEMVHIKQYLKYPIIFPFLYYKELLTNGYKNNRYEREACGSEKSE